MFGQIVAFTPLADKTPGFFVANWILDLRFKGF